VLGRAGPLRAAGVEPILVAPPAFHYSGLATAVLSGALPPERAVLDVAALAARFGVPHIAGKVAAVDRQARRLCLSDGQELAYDAVSFNIGSVTDSGGDLPGEGETWPVKPLSGLAGLRARLDDHIADGVSPSTMVAGGGPTGFEVAAALAGRMERAGLSPRVVILRRSTPDWAPGRALERLSAALQSRGILQTSGEAASRRPGEVLLSDGRALPCDLLVLATGLQAPTIVGGLGLDPATTRLALESLPPQVTLAFSPYTPGLQDWINQARARGHEVLLEVPMEPEDYPENDPGPFTLRARAQPVETVKRLEWILSRGTGYFGILNRMGERFVKSPEGMGALSGALRSRGLAFIDTGIASTSGTAEFRASANQALDTVLVPAAIDESLLRVEAAALSRGEGLGIAQAYPLSLRQVASWAGQIEGRGFQLAPASALARIR